MPTEFEAAIIGGIIGGFLGVIGTMISSYWGPLLLEKNRERKEEKRIYGPRKRFLKQILEGEYDWYRLSTLARATGTTKEECRALLIQIGARGSLKEKNDDEMWTLEKRNPIAKELEKRKNVEN